MSNRELPMMPWFPQDFASATAAWTVVERALYRELLDAQWVLGRLPTDLKRLARLAKFETAEFTEAWTTVSDKFEERTDITGTWFYNKRLEEHRADSRAYVEQRSIAGRASAAARRQRALQRDEHGRSNGSLTVVGTPVQHPSPSPSPSEDQERDIGGSRGRKAQARPSRRCPPDWQPDQVDAVKLKEQCPGVDFPRELAKFRDHTFGTPRVDWDATWRNWVRIADERLGRGRGLNGLRREPYKAPLTVEQIESEIARGLRDAGGSRIPGVHPDLQGGSK